MWTFIKLEWKYWLRSPMLWIFLTINTLLIFGAVSSDNITIGGGNGSVHKNAPHVIQTYYGIMSLLTLLMTTAFMNSTANRDFDSGMYQFIFSSPIKKRNYFFGKFIGAVSIAIIPLLGVSIGSLLGPAMPWIQPERYGQVIWSGHLHGLLSFGIPNTVIVAVLVYSLAIIFRNNIVSFVGAMLFLTLYGVSAGFTSDIEKEWLANILDPFGFRPKNIISKYMTVDEKNLRATALSGAFLMNRIIWLCLSAAVLFLTFFRFSFNKKKEKTKKVRKEIGKNAVINLTNKTYLPNNAGGFSLRTFWNLILFETKAIIKNPTFIIIVIIGMMNLIASLTSFTTRYGSEMYPVTYSVVDRIQSSFGLFIMAIITFYTGVLVWKERDAKINEIQDATPIKTGLLFSSKVVAILFSLALILCLAILTGIITQVLFGHTRFQLDVYAKSLLVMDLLQYAYLIVIALFFHYVINNRYIAYFAFIAFVIVNSFIWNVLEVNTNMLKFGGTPSIIYSDMNGFGPFVLSATWFNIYWALFCVFLCFGSFSFFIRGKETQFKKRLKNARSTLSKNKVVVSISLIAFMLCGSFVYYNTKVLNSYDSPKEAENKRVEYEKKYKKYEDLIQPRFYKYNYTIDLMPYERNMTTIVDAWARNKSNETINELHFTMPSISDSVQLSIKGTKLKMKDVDLGYWIYTLDKPMGPNDSILITCSIKKITKGFENQVSFTQLTQNGTFFNNKAITPSFGYEKGMEISNKNKRIELGLPKRPRMAKLDENDLKTRANIYITNDADWVDVTTTISTSLDQIAIAPGSLIKTWEENGKKYFTYKLDHKSFDFYSFISGKYEIARKKWNGIDIEVYYTKEHEYNVPNMLKSIEKSLEYYTKNFGPYYHKQCRIIEFPRYSSFAQAFPGTMPYSESIGFITDLRDVTEDDIDQVFYVVAHEMGHQYWAHQVCGPAMQGSEMMSEGFSQYSALMVMENEYGKDKMKKFLKYEMDGYLRARSNEFEAERPLMLTEGQQYIHYQKASIIMYYLKEMVGEDNVNKALRSLIDTFAYKQPPYPTALSAVRAFRSVTPDSLQYIIDDMFENITIFSNRVLEGTYKKIGDEYEVKMNVRSEKYRADTLGKESSIPISDYVDIGVFAEPASNENLGKVLVMKRMKITENSNEFTFRVKEKPYQVGIDPYNFLIDRIPDDNIKNLTSL